MRQVRLGMSASELTRLLGRTVDPKPEETAIAFRKNRDDLEEISIVSDEAEHKKVAIKRRLGLASFSAVGVALPSDSFSDVLAIHLSFFEGRVFRIMIMYKDSGVKWDLDAFLEAVSKPLDIPKGAWDRRFVEHGFAFARCGEVNFSATFVSGTPGLLMTDEVTDKHLKEMKRQAWIDHVAEIEARQKSFVP